MAMQSRSTPVVVFTLSTSFPNRVYIVFPSSLPFLSVLLFSFFSILHIGTPFFVSADVTLVNRSTGSRTLDRAATLEAIPDHFYADITPGDEDEDEDGADGGTDEGAEALSSDTATVRTWLPSLFVQPCSHVYMPMGACVRVCVCACVRALFARALCRQMIPNLPLFLLSSPRLFPSLAISSPASPL